MLLHVVAVVWEHSHKHIKHSHVARIVVSERWTCQHPDSPYEAASLECREPSITRALNTRTSAAEPPEARPHRDATILATGSKYACRYAHGCMDGWIRVCDYLRIYLSAKMHTHTHTDTISSKSRNSFQASGTCDSAPNALRRGLVDVPSPSN